MRERGTAVSQLGAAARRADAQQRPVQRWQCARLVSEGRALRTHRDGGLSAGSPCPAAA